MLFALSNILNVKYIESNLGGFMKTLVILLSCLFVQNSFALQAGRYQGVIEAVKKGKVVTSKIPVIAFVTEQMKNGSSAFFIEFYNPNEPHKARTSTYLMIVEPTHTKQIEKFGHFTLVRKGMFDVVQPIRFAEQLSKLAVAPLKVLFADDSYVTLRFVN